MTLVDLVLARGAHFPMRVVGGPGEWDLIQHQWTQTGPELEFTLQLEADQHPRHRLNRVILENVGETPYAAKALQACHAFMTDRRGNSAQRYIDLVYLEYNPKTRCGIALLPADAESNPLTSTDEFLAAFTPQVEQSGILRMLEDIKLGKPLSDGETRTLAKHLHLHGTLLRAAIYSKQTVPSLLQLD